MSIFKTKNLIEYLEEQSEERVQKFLSSYSCPPNKDIEFFLRERAILFTKSSSARTFVISIEDAGYMEFVGYFTLTHKSLVLEDFTEVSKSLEKKIKWFSDTYQIGDMREPRTIQIASMILIAQLGKNYTNGVNKLISGQQLLDIAFEKIIEIQRDVGGRFVCVECEDSPNLLKYYIANGFVRLQNRYTGDKGDYFVQLVRTS